MITNNAILVGMVSQREQVYVLLVLGIESVQMLNKSIYFGMSCLKGRDVPTLLVTYKFRGGHNG